MKHSKTLATCRLFEVLIMLILSCFFFLWKCYVSKVEKPRKIYLCTILGLSINKLRPAHCENVSKKTKSMLFMSYSSTSQKIWPLGFSNPPKRSLSNWLFSLWNRTLWGATMDFNEFQYYWMTSVKVTGLLCNKMFKICHVI